MNIHTTHGVEDIASVDEILAGDERLAAAGSFFVISTQVKPP
jgi:hypothetical protein